MKKLTEDALFIADLIQSNTKDTEVKVVTLEIKLLDNNRKDISKKLYKAENIAIEYSYMYEDIFKKHNINDYKNKISKVVVYEFKTEDIANKLGISEEEYNRISFVVIRVETKCTKTFNNNCQDWVELTICKECGIKEEDFNKIFPKAHEQKRKEVLEVFNKYCCVFEINTPLRVSHFFAQIRAEVGDKLVGTEESLFYSENGLKSIFGRYFTKFSDEIDKFAYKGKIDEFTYRKLSDLEKKKYIKFGKKYYTQLANEDEIAKRVYCCDDNGFVLKQGGCQNGLLYKGKGFIQLTWKSNYEAVNKILKRKVPKENLDILNNPNSLLETKVGMLSAMGFWEWKKLNSRADKGATDSVVDSIINVVNEKTESRNNRKKYFQDIYKILKDTK